MTVSTIQHALAIIVDNGAGRGAYGNGSSTPNRDYNGNNRPNRDYNGNTPNRSSREYNGTSSRGGYDNSAPDYRNGPGSAPNAGTDNTSPSSRFDANRGAYSPGSSQSGGSSRGEAQPGGFQQQPGRSYERAERPGGGGSFPSPAAPSMSGGRSDGGSVQRMPDSRGDQNQPQGQPQQLHVPNSRGENQRGPR